MICITAFFNPNGSPLRKRNYQTFRANLPYPLIVVEFSNTGSFEISPDANTVHIKVSKGDRLWQKERLLNIGIERAMQEGHTKVVCLDCDIIFENENWFEQVEIALDQNDLVQCFSQVSYLSASDSSFVQAQKPSNGNVELVLPSVVKLINNNLPLFAPLPPAHKTSVYSNRSTGMAWAMRIDKNFYGLYEYCIIGGGDSVLIASAASKLDQLFAGRKFSEGHKKSILQWDTKRFTKQTKIGHIYGNIFHLWHGPISQRQYSERYQALAESGYDPMHHITKECGVGLTLNSTTDAKKVHAVINRYFDTRKDQ